MKLVIDENINKSRDSCSLSYISLNLFSLLFIKNTINTKKNVLSNRDYLLLIYMFMCILIFLRILILSFQSHQIRILSTGLGMAWNLDGLSCIWTLLFQKDSVPDKTRKGMAKSGRMCPRPNIVLTDGSFIFSLAMRPYG